MKVALFPTCLGDEMYPEVVGSTVRVLERLGCEVDQPDVPLCCGQPAFNSGHVGRAKGAAAAWLDAYQAADFIVAPSGSCSGMIHHNLSRLFEDDAGRRAIAGRAVSKTYEFSQFLVEVLGVDRLDASFPHPVTYHASCHATRLLGLREAPLALLRAVGDLRLAPLPRVEDCCGFGGAFAVKLGAISTTIVDEKIEHIESTGAHFVTSTDLGCLMNIAGRMERLGVKVEAIHLASLLDRALGEKEART